MIYYAITPKHGLAEGYTRYANEDDFSKVQELVFQVTEDHQKAADASCWCELATIGENYDCDDFTIEVVEENGVKDMYIWKFTIEVEKEIDRSFGKIIIRNTVKRYIAANSYEQAYGFLFRDLEKRGWSCKLLDAKEIYLHDIRDNCDHLTE